MSIIRDLNLAIDIVFGSVGSELSQEEATLIRQAFGAAIKEAESYTKGFESSFDRYQRLFDGRHFKNEYKAELEPSYVVLNELSNHIRYLSSWLTDRVPRIRVFPASPGAEDEAALLMRRVLTSYFVSQRMKADVRSAYEDALIFGAGFFRTYWDPFCEQGIGALKAECVAPYHISPGPGCDELSEGPYFVVTRYLDSYEIEKHRSTALGAPTKEEEDWRSTRAAGGIQIGQYTTVETRPFFTASSRDVSLQEEQKELKKVYDIWVLRDEEQTWYKVTTDLEFIYSPLHKYSALPFAHFRFQKLRSRRFYGQGLCELLYYPQRVLDEITSMVNRQIHFTADPIWVEEAGARDTGRPGLKRVKPGQVIFVEDGYKGRVGFESPPQLQTAQFEMIQFMLSAFERATGMNAFMRGMTPQRREFVGVAEAMAEASQVLVRSVSEDFERQVEHALEGAAAIVASSMLTGRTMYLVEDESPDLYVEIGDRPFIVQDEPMRFKVHFESGTSMAISRDTRAALALRFHAATGGVLGSEWLAKELGIDGSAELVAEAEAKKQQSQIAMLESINQAAEAVVEAARIVIGGENAEDNQGRDGQAGLGAEEDLGQGEGIDWGQGGALPPELRGVNAPPGSQIPSPSPVIPG